MDKKEVLNRIKGRDINFKLKEDLFGLLDENINRIQFVTDHIGIRDFMFIAEKGTNFTADFYTAIDTDSDQTYDIHQNLNAFKEKYTEQPLKCFAEVANFFEKTDRILYVGIGFKECLLTEDDEKKILKDFRSGLIKSYDEGARKYRRFPEWYKKQALEPEQVHFISKKAEFFINNELKRVEENKVREEIDKILDKKNLTKNDKELLASLSEQLKEHAMK